MIRQLESRPLESEEIELSHPGYDDAMVGTDFKTIGALARHTHWSMTKSSRVAIDMRLDVCYRARMEKCL